MVQGHDAPEPVFMKLKKYFCRRIFSCMFRADQVMTKPEITKKYINAHPAVAEPGQGIGCGKILPAAYYYGVVNNYGKGGESP